MILLTVQRLIIQPAVSMSASGTELPDRLDWFCAIDVSGQI